MSINFVFPNIVAREFDQQQYLFYQVIKIFQGFGI